MLGLLASRSPRMWDIAALSLLYAAGYALFAVLWGTGFDRTQLFYLSQHLHVAWLVEDLLGSLLLLHSQPPLWNGLIGLVYLLGIERYFPLLYIMAGVASLCLIQATLRLFSIRPQIRWALLGMLALSPTLHLYGTWYYCTHFELLLFSAALYFLAHAALHSQARTCHMVLGCLMLCCLGLMRGQWHLSVLLGFAVLYGWAIGRAEWKRWACCCLIFILPLSGLYTKNLFMFGFFGPSSWMGSNLAQVAFESLTQLEYDLYKQNGLVHPLFPIDVNMVHVLKVLPPEALPADLPAVLGSPYKSQDLNHYNANYLGMLATADIDMHDSLFIISENPLAYGSRVLRQFFRTIATPSAFHPYVDLSNIKGHVPHLGRYLLIPGAVLLYGIIPLSAAFLAFRSRRSTEGRFLLSVILFLLAMSLTACMLNGIEQERMRWGMQAGYVLLAAIMLEKCCRMRHRYIENPEPQ